MGAFEDAGWFCVDNLPPGLLPALADLFAARGLAGGARRGGRATCAAASGSRSSSRCSTRVAAARGVRAAGRVPRGVRRGAAQPLPRDAPAAIRSRPAARWPTASSASAPSSRSVRARADVVIDTTGLLDLGPAPPRRRGADGARTAGRGCTWSSCRSATSTASRATPTSCSTCASCATRTTSPELRPLTGLDAPVRRLRDGGARAWTSSERAWRRSSTSCSRPTPQEGKTSLVDRASAAPAAATAASPSPRCSPSATTHDLDVRHVAPPRRPRPSAARRRGRPREPAAPRIAALGGGTGLSVAAARPQALARGHHRDRHRGRRRRLVGAAPARARACCRRATSATAWWPSPTTSPSSGALFQHRFAEGDLSGHSFGNLFLAALSEVTGNFDLRDPGVQPGAEHPRPGAALDARPDPPLGRARRRRAWSAARRSHHAGAAAPAAASGWQPEPPAHPPALEAIARGRSGAPRPREPLHQRAAAPRGARARRGGGRARRDGGPTSATS